MTRDEIIAAAREVFPDARVVEDNSEREWALLRSGKLDEELRAVQEIGRHAVFYAMLRGALVEINSRFREKKVFVCDKTGRPILDGYGHRVIRQRKPGWAAHFYRKHFGEWPDRAWEKIAPMRPNEEVAAAIKARDALWRRMVKERKQEEERNARRGVEDGEAADAVQQGDESAGAMLDGGRMPGLEEQDDRAGELCEADE